MEDDITIVRFENEERFIEDFLNLPKRLYHMELENAGEVRDILNGKHIFSKYFRVQKLLAYKGGQCAGRCIFTEYDSDDSLYIGFFECINSKNVAAKLLGYYEDYAKQHGYHKLIGPVNASFWIGYRMKLDHFHEPPYLCEPYNREYYPILFQENGFILAEEYTSTVYRPVPKDYSDRLLSGFYSRCVKKGYEIRNIRPSEYEICMSGIYALMTELYSGFPTYKSIDREDFLQYFNRYRYILDFRFAKMAYDNGKPIGFFIGVPDYGSCLHALTPANLIQAVLRRFRPQRYVLLYLGAREDYRGLGLALAQEMINELKRTDAESIGALSRNGRVGKVFAVALQQDSYRYGLFAKSIL